MRWDRQRIDVDGEWQGSMPLDGSGSVQVGPLEVEVNDHPGQWPSTTWSLANHGEVPVPVHSVSLVHRLEVTEPLDLFVNGYQSWSHTGSVRWGAHRDPSSVDGSPELVRSMHHADQSVLPPGVVRSAAVMVLADAGSSRLLVGFDSGQEHDGTIIVRPGETGIELVAQAFLGGAVLGPGERRPLHGVVAAEGDDPSALLEAWATYVGARQGARTSSPFQVGWCSWYQYFHGISEDAIRDNLARAEGWPFDVFQIDDGFEAAVGDWLRTNDRFSSEIDRLSADIAAAGYRPGIWMAPFLAAPASEVYRGHPEWMAQHASGRPLVGNVVPEWGGKVFTLDTTRPEVLDHLEALAHSMVEAGYTYLKLDFTYAPSLDGSYADPSRTPAQRVRAGYDAIRRGAGDDAFILGCGAPLACLVGVVDGMRIGPDVAPAWAPEPTIPGYDDTVPATANAWRNTLARSFMHRRFWLNDPDCLMLRHEDTRLDAAAIETWARAVGVSGGMALVSDDMALLGPAELDLLDRVLAIGRSSDADADGGRPPRCADLLVEEVPVRLESDEYVLIGDADRATSTLRRRIDMSGA